MCNGGTGEVSSPARRAARLSMLAPDGEAEARIERELDEIISFANELGELECEARPALQPTKAEAPLRPDEPKPGLGVEEALMNAKSVSGRLITIPRAFE